MSTQSELLHYSRVLQTIQSRLTPKQGWFSKKEGVSGAERESLMELVVWLNAVAAGNLDNAPMIDLNGAMMTLQKLQAHLYGTLSAEEVSVCQSLVTYLAGYNPDN
jgi:hypothetical protein